MTPDETKESKEASGMMSFFSIVTSQSSLPEGKNVRRKSSMFYNILASGHGVITEAKAGSYINKESETKISKQDDIGVPTICENNKADIKANKDFLSPNITIRVSNRMVDKLKNSDLYHSILSDGSIRLDDLDENRLSHISDHFEEIAKVTNSSIKQSIETMTKRLRKKSSNLISGNRLALVLKRLQVAGGGTVS